ncbi:MAG: hypothetical protein GXY01_06735 [Clostridiales bacterium]|nr:hypothetical protein [Clostridiales bacterium]
MNEMEGMINKLLSNPDDMKKIMDMAGQIMGTDSSAPSGASESGEQQAEPSHDDIPSLDNMLSGLDSIPGGLTSVVQKLMGSPAAKTLMSGALNTKNDKQELLMALKPWLSEKRKHKLEKAIMFAKVMRFAGAAALKRGG